LGWVPNTMMARLVRVIEVASVAMSWTCHVRARMSGSPALVGEPERGGGRRGATPATGYGSPSTRYGVQNAVAAQHVELAVGEVDEPPTTPNIRARPVATMA